MFPCRVRCMRCILAREALPIISAISIMEIAMKHDAGKLKDGGGGDKAGTW